MATRINRRTVLSLINKEANDNAAITGSNLPALAADIVRRLGHHHRCANKTLEIIESLVNEGVVEMREAMLVPVSVSAQRERKHKSKLQRRRDRNNRKVTISKRLEKERRYHLNAWHQDELASA